MGVQYLRELDVLEVDLWPLLPRMRIQSWNRGMQVQVLVGDDWRPARSSRGVRVLQGDIGRSEFVEAIPKRALDLSLECGAHQLAALRLLRGFPEASDLASTPNLVWLIARRLDARRLDDAALRVILRRRRHEVLSWCLRVELPPSSVRLLAKVSLPDQSERSYRVLRRALSSAVARRVLGQLPTISLEQLALTVRSPELTRLPCFVEGLNPPYPGLPDVVTMHRRTLRLGNALGLRNVAAMVRAARYDELLGMYHRWSSREAERHALDDLVTRYGKALPAAPFPGTDDLVPIATAAELIEEAVRMQHCVLTYAEDLYEGHCAIYRVLRPERATFMLRLPGGTLEELAGPRDAPVSPECVAAVESWLAASQAARSQAGAT